MFNSSNLIPPENNVSRYKVLSNDNSSNGTSRFHKILVVSPQYTATKGTT